MFDFTEFASEFGNATNTTDNGTAYREATKEDISKALLGEAVEFLSDMPIKDDTPLSSLVAAKLAKQATDCDDLSKFIFGKLLDLKSRNQACLAAENKEGVAEVEAAVQGVLQFIRRIQSNAGRSSYFRYQDALKHETAGADKGRQIRSDYDGWQSLTLDPSTVEEATDELFDNLTQLYGFTLNMASKWARTNMGVLPFSSARVGTEFQDFTDRAECWKQLESNKPTAATNKGVLSMI